MTTCLVGFISLLGSLSCSGPDPIGPRQDTLRPAPMLAVGSSGPCARVHVQIVGGTTAQASFAADSGCATGLALVGAGTVGYVKNQRKVSIPVRVVNRGPGGRDAPILVTLLRDSGVVTAPGTVTARVVEANADSVGGAGGADAGAAFWTLLESGGTITGDSTPIRTLQLVVPNKTTAARLGFEIRAELPDSALPIIVDRLGFPEDSSIVLPDSLLPEWHYYRRVLGVFLAPGADGIAFSALLAKFQGTVVGGSQIGRMYAVRFPDHGPSWTSMKAFLDSLHAEPIVSAAGPLLAHGPKGRIDGERLPPAKVDPVVPIIPNRMVFPEEKAYAISPGLPHDPNALFYRRLIALRLTEGASGPEFRSLADRYQADLVGGSRLTSLMILRVADRGPSWTALTALLDSIRAEEIVDFAGLYRNDELVSPFDSSAVRPSQHRRVEVPDTVLPPIPDRMTFAAESLFVIQDSLVPGYDYYRRMIGVRLRPEADGVAFRALLKKYDATLAGGSSFARLYILKFPDPGPTWAEVKALLDSLHREPIVRVAGPMTRRGGPGRAPGRIAPASEGARRTGDERLDSLPPSR